MEVPDLNPPERTFEVPGRGPLLSELFPGDDKASIREQILNNGKVLRGKSTIHVSTRPLGNQEYEVMAIAAVARDPGLTQDYIDQVQDFLGQTTKSQEARIKQLWEIYYNEGIPNNAVNKLSALMTAGGRFKVRHAKKGRKPNSTESLEAVLREFTTNLNNNGDDGVITGSKGVAAVTLQGVRQSLVEGDWFGRQIWTKHVVPGQGVFSLPMNIQTISSRYMVPIKELETAATGSEEFYWQPPAAFVQILKKPPTKEVKDFVKKFIPKDILAPLIKDGKVRLDPALSMHLKHRGQDNNPFGESFLKPAMQAIAFKRMLYGLESVTMQNLINRLTIVMVGSDDPTSPFFKQDVAQYRAALMQQFFEDPGPNMTIVWAGHDVEVKDVGAHTTVLALDTRHELAIKAIKDALGVSEAVLSGSTADGKAAGWASTMVTGAQLAELQNGFETAWTTVGQRIAMENGFTEYDVIFEFDNSLLVDRVEEQVQTRLDYTAGLITIQDLLESRGRNAEAVFLRKCFEKGLTPESTTWEAAFMPPPAMPGMGGPDAGGPGQGRVPDNQQGKPAKKPVEKKKL